MEGGVHTIEYNKQKKAAARQAAARQPAARPASAPADVVMRELRVRRSGVQKPRVQVDKSNIVQEKRVRAAPEVYKPQVSLPQRRKKGVSKKILNDINLFYTQTYSRTHQLDLNKTIRDIKSIQEYVSQQNNLIKLKESHIELIDECLKVLQKPTSQQTSREERKPSQGELDIMSLIMNLENIAVAEETPVPMNIGQSTSSSKKSVSAMTKRIMGYRWAKNVGQLNELREKTIKDIDDIYKNIKECRVLFNMIIDILTGRGELQMLDITDKIFPAVPNQKYIYKKLQAIPEEEHMQEGGRRKSRSQKSRSARSN